MERHPAPATEFPPTAHGAAPSPLFPAAANIFQLISRSASDFGTLLIVPGRNVSCAIENDHDPKFAKVNSSNPLGCH